MVKREICQPGGGEMSKTGTKSDREKTWGNVQLPVQKKIFSSDLSKRLHQMEFNIPIIVHTVIFQVSIIFSYNFDQEQPQRDALNREWY